MPWQSPFDVTQDISLFIPRLNDRLPGDPAAIEHQGRDAQDIRAVGIFTGLREGEPVAFRNRCFDLVGHCRAADIVPELRDG